jgi:hypothetical protein
MEEELSTLSLHADDLFADAYSEAKSHAVLAHTQQRAALSSVLAVLSLVEHPYGTCTHARARVHSHAYLHTQARSDTPASLCAMVFQLVPVISSITCGSAQCC